MTPVASGQGYAAAGKKTLRVNKVMREECPSELFSVEVQGCWRMISTCSLYTVLHSDSTQSVRNAPQVSTVRWVAFPPPRRSSRWTFPSPQHAIHNDLPSETR